MKTIYLLAVALLFATTGYTQNPDTVKISLGKTSRIIFTMEDPEDLDILKHYNFQQLFSDILKKLEEKDKMRSQKSDSTASPSDDENPVITERDDEGEEDETDSQDDSWRDDDDDGDNDDWNAERRSWNRTRQSFNFDLGMNNILEDGKFPDDSNPYAVRPWGSWYVGLASVQRSRLARNFFLEWGLGLNWYTFKFEDDNTRIIKDDDGVTFVPDTRDVNFLKSKLSVSYIQASLIPVIDFNDRHQKHRFWDGHKNSFRIGAGPYIGYRISSRSKLVYSDNGRERDKDRDSFYLNNFRYGMRLQVGYRSTDLFFNYDLNELFREGKGPGVNAISFGVIF